MIKKKHIIIIQAAIIILLLFLVLRLNFKGSAAGNSKTIIEKKNSSGLLSPRVYAGLLTPRSLLVTNYAPLRKSLESFINDNNLTASIYVENLRNGASMGINEREGFPAASLSKVPLSIIIMRRIEDGEISLDTYVPINSSVKTSTWGALFKTNEQKLPIRVLIEKMLKESDNTALNILRQYSDLNDSSLVLSYVDYYSEESIDTHDENNIELVTVKSMYNVFSSLYLSTILDSQDSEYILSLLANSTFNIKYIAQLPDDVIVAHKFGARYIDNDKAFHDCGIIYRKEMRIFYCVMTKDLNYNYAIQVAGTVINKIYEYSLNARKTLDEYK